MALNHVIDLTVESNGEDGPIDLTRDSSVDPSTSRAHSPNPNDTSQSTSRRKKPKSRKRNKKKTKDDSVSNSVNHTNNDADANSTTTKPSLADRIGPANPNVIKLHDSSSKQLTPKRKRRESVDSNAQGSHTVKDELRPPPKRHKSDNLPHQPPETPHNDEESNKVTNYTSGNGKGKPKDKSEQRQAPTKKSEEAKPSDSNNNPPNSRRQRKKRSSQSPIPQSRRSASPEFGRKANNPNPPRTRNSRNGRNASRASSVGSNGRASIPPSPAGSAAGSALFFVDTDPNPENKYHEDVVKSTYRLELGNLLLPEHVLLETTEEAIQTPGNEALPPPSPVSSEQSIDVIDDSLKHTRRYWEPEAAPAEVGECRICGLHHTSKLCIGTSVCFTCGSTAHQARRCPFKTACFRCGVVGHVQAECPVPRNDIKVTHDCYLCGSNRHGTHNCARNWRVYTYRDSAARDEDVQRRLAAKPDIIKQDDPLEEDAYVGLEPWCYNCGDIGHLGDDCIQEGMDDKPREKSAFGESNVLYGPFAPRYRRIADDVRKQMKSSKYIMFGDQVLEGLDLQPPTRLLDFPLPSHVPLRPGMAARQREKESLGRSRGVRDDDDDDDWFNRRNERPAPKGPPRNWDRDRDRDRDRERDRDGDRNREEREHRRQRSRDRDRDRDRDRNRERDRERDRERGKYSTNGKKYQSPRQRPPSPSVSPPPPPPPPSYPSYNDIRAGYLPSKAAASSSDGISIRGAAIKSNNHNNDNRSGHGHSGGGGGGGRNERDRNGRSHSQQHRGDNRDEGYGRNKRERDRYEDRSNGHGSSRRY